jgi:ABC-type multidrug transport system fused ATPase/permease subunit
VLVQRGEITVGEIVAFVGFAGLLIGKLDSLSGFAVRIFQYAPTLRSFFDLLDATDGVREKPGAKPLEGVAGNVRYDDRHVPLPQQRPGRVRRQLRGARRQDRRAGRADRRRARPPRSHSCNACALPTRAASWSTASTSPT